jgi:hypothetical protein
MCEKHLSFGMKGREAFKSTVMIVPVRRRELREWREMKWEGHVFVS